MPQPEPKLETVHVEYGPSTGLRAAPDPAQVKRGTRVQWVFDLRQAPPEELDVRVVFREASPFFDRRDGRQFRTRVRGGTLAAVEAGPAEVPGDYKYDLVIDRADSGRTFIEVDPHLIVFD
ncbi:MAG TPA: hypothetical protein VGD56_17985 [Gemmatirosa sp.]